jgi:hypothetical protein
MTPLQAEILLHYYVRGGECQYRNGDFSSLAVVGLLEGFLLHDMLVMCGTDRFSITDKGKTWVEAALATPMPVQVPARWMVPGRAAVEAVP